MSHDAVVVGHQPVARLDQEAGGGDRVVRADDERQLAVVGDDGTVEIRQVEMGPRVDDEWVVNSGLQTGERVALEGLQRLRPGAKVVAKPAPAPEGG